MIVDFEVEYRIDLVTISEPVFRLRSIIVNVWGRMAVEYKVIRGRLYSRTRPGPLSMSYMMRGSSACGHYATSSSM